MNNLTKAVVVILGLILIVGAALWIIGGKKTRYATSLEIDAPPQVVFPYLTEGELQKQWIRGLLDFTAPNDSQSEVGSIAQVTIRNGDRQYRYQDTVLRHEKDSLLSIRSENNIVSNVLVYRLEERQGKTYLDFNVKKSRLGMGRLLALFSKDLTQDQIQNDIRNLKQLVEKNYNPTSTQ